jgi:hypothetical protein
MDQLALNSGEPATPTISDWFITHNIQCQKVNVREWGSYEVGLSVDGGQNWAVMQDQVFGFRYQLEESAQTALTTIIKSGTFDRPSLVNWLGQERVDELLSILG